MDFQKLAAALRKEAKQANWGAATEALERAADAIEHAIEPTPSPAPDVVREALEIGRGYRGEGGFWTGPPAMSMRERLNSACVAALAALDAPAGPETLPEWAKVREDGTLHINLVDDGSHAVFSTRSSADLDRISIATRIRAAQLRKGEKR